MKPSKSGAGKRGRSNRSKRAGLQDRQIIYARMLGLALAAGGFIAIGLGWAGAARRACVDCQIPYIISGGAAGVALVVFGAAMLLMAQVRAEGLRLASRMQPAASGSTGEAPAMGAGGPNGQAARAESPEERPDSSTSIMIVEGATEPAEVDAGPG